MTLSVVPTLFMIFMTVSCLTSVKATEVKVVAVKGVEVETPAIAIQRSAEPTQYDPLMIEDGVGLEIAANTIATPYEYNSHGDLKRALVDSVYVSRNRKRYVFRFKKNLKWSDGVDFHARHFMNALLRIQNEKVPPLIFIQKLISKKQK